MNTHNNTLPLKNNERLDDLCERISLSQLKWLIRHLITDKDYDALKQYDYLNETRLSSAKEQVDAWLQSMPPKRKENVRDVLDELFIEALQEKNENTLDIVLTISNLGAVGGVSEKQMESALEYDMDETMELKINLSLLELHRRQRYPFSKADVDYWEDKISIADRPHLAVVLMSLYEQYKPLKALECFVRLDELYPQNPVNSEIRLVFMRQLRDTTLNFIQYYDNLQDATAKCEEYLKWVSKIKNQWIRILIHEVLQLSQMDEIREELKKTDNKKLISNLPYEKSEEEAEKGIKKASKDLKKHLESFKI